MKRGSTAAAILKFCESFDGELLELPLSMLMQTIFIGGNKGAGKTSALKRLFEAAHRAGAQCGVIAPLGRWWSLRIAKNGRSRGLRDVFVFGGKHGDVPIDRNSGRIVARTVVQKRLHFVLDVELMRKDDRAQFLGDFLEELWALKKEEDASHAMVLFIDEAQVVAPQKSTDKGVNRMREFAADLCREGRNHGVGMVLGAQRSANVDKDLLALVEMLIVMRTIHHLDRKVYQLWIDEKSDRDDDDGAWLKRLRRLEKGQAYLYAPELNIFERVRVLLPDTYDATRTATLGEKVAAVGKLSKLDVRKLGDELGKIVETASANDPEALRRKISDLTARIGELERQKEVDGGWRAKNAGKPPRVVEQKIAKQDLKRLEKFVSNGDRLVADLNGLAAHLTGLTIEASKSVKGIVASISSALIKPGYAIGVSRDSATPVRVEMSVRGMPLRASDMIVTDPTAPLPRVTKRATGADEVKTADEPKTFGGKMLEIRRALAVKPMDRKTLAVAVGLKPGGSTFITYMGHLVRGGFATSERGGIVRLTPDGEASVRGLEPYSLSVQSIALRHHVGGGAGRILEHVIAERRRQGSVDLSRAGVGEAVGLPSNGSTFITYAGHLKRSGLIDTAPGHIRASNALFTGEP